MELPEIVAIGFEFDEDDNLTIHIVTDGEMPLWARDQMETALNEAMGIVGRVKMAGMN